MKCRKLAVTNIVSLLCILSIILTGCSPSNPVRYITILKTTASGAPPPGGWSLYPGTVHFQAAVQATSSPNAEMFIGLIIDERFDKTVTFSGCSILDTQTGEEETLRSADDLGPYEPGHIFSFSFTAPDEPGVYEIRLYYEDSLVASAPFEIQ